MFDLIIKNGTLIDGSGSPAFISDIGVQDRKIEVIQASLSSSCKTELDVAGKVVCPGFIDIHSHTDATILQNPKAESKIRQGITTEIVGNCGMSAAPLSVSFLPELTSMPAEIMGLKTRGTLTPKMVADITVFDPNTVSDMATFENPHQYSKGIEYVMVAGEVIIDHGRHSNKMEGNVLK
jgi:N-acyl-D-aspartate/D-glutamate deacylase